MAQEQIQIQQKLPSNGVCAALPINGCECDSKHHNGMTSSQRAFNIRSVVLPPGCRLPSNVVFAMDVGGTLAKLVYVERSSSQVRNRKYAHCNCESINEDDADDVVKLKLVTFDADNIDLLLDFIDDVVLPRRCQGHGKTQGCVRTLGSRILYPPAQGACACQLSTGCRLNCALQSPVCIARATGVGCILRRDYITSTLSGVDFRFDGREMDHCVAGINFLWRNLVADELLHADMSDIDGLTFQTALVSSGALPCLVVNMGSALTIVQVNADGRVAGIVGGSIQGGMTFLGLGRLLTKATSFNELMEMASRGRCQEVDLTVKDVAGTEYNSNASDVIVSSFGKVAKRKALDPDAVFNEEDLAASLMYCIIEEMVKTVYLVAKAQSVNTAVFCGSFFANDKSMMTHVRRKIRVCVTYLGHQLSAVFLKHNGYLGAVGLLSGDDS